MGKIYETTFLGTLIEYISFGHIDLETWITYKENYMEIDSLLFKGQIKYDEIVDIETKHTRIKIYNTDSEIIHLVFLHPVAVNSIYALINSQIENFNEKIKLEQERLENEKKRQLELQQEQREKEERKRELELQRQKEEEARKRELELQRQKEEERKRKLRLQRQLEEQKKYYDELYNDNIEYILVLEKLIDELENPIVYPSGSFIKSFSQNFIKEFKKLEFFKTKYKEEIFPICRYPKLDNIIDFFENRRTKKSYLRLIREKYISQELSLESIFFDTIGDYGLKPMQRRACVINNDNNLVLAGAGSGKTFVMVSRAAYLIKKKIATPSEILILAYNTKAAEELRERCKMFDEIKLYSKYEIRKNKEGKPYKYYFHKNVATFHSFGKNVINQVNKNFEDVISQSDKKQIVKNVLFELFDKVDELQSMILEYFTYHNYQYPDTEVYDFKSIGEYSDFMQSFNISSIKPDDKSYNMYEECIIANFLFLHDINYTVNKKLENSFLWAKFYLDDYDIYIFCIKSFAEKNEAFNKKLSSSQLSNLKYISFSNKDYINAYNIEKKLRKSFESFSIDLKLLSPKEILNNIKEGHTYNKLIDLLISFISLYKNANDGILDELLLKYSGETMSERRITLFINIFKNIYPRYKETLSSLNKIDFDDMISDAKRYINEGKYSSPYRYIMIDEFQDISNSRAELIKSLLSSVEMSNLFCVGDDWQAIYRFSGSDIKFLSKFKKEFSDKKLKESEKSRRCSITKLDYTFRFNNKILNTSTNFVRQNEEQIPKEINVIKEVDEPKINIVYKSKEINEKVLEIILDKISDKVSKANMSDKKESVLILNRYTTYKKTEESKSKEEAQKYFKSEKFDKYNFDILYDTIHGSKGKEADYVILIDVKSGFSSFPSQKDSDEIIEMMLPEKEDYPFAEERRLMYVALTRARNEVWIEADKQNESIFVNELVVNEKEIYEVNILDYTHIGNEELKGLDLSCPKCKKGTIEKYYNKQKEPYYKCNRCSYTLKKCINTEECPGNATLFRESENRYYCVVCKKRFKVCQECNNGIRTLYVDKNNNKSIQCSNRYVMNCKPNDDDFEEHKTSKDVIFPQLYK